MLEISAERKKPAVPSLSLKPTKLVLRCGHAYAKERNKTSIDWGCVVVLVMAILVQGVVALLDLPGRVELLADFAPLALLGWVLITVVRNVETIEVHGLVLAFIALIALGALRSDDFMRLIVSAHYLLFPALALGLATLGRSERRNRTVIIATLLLVSVTFLVTIIQALSVSHVDFVTGTFGESNGWSVVFAVFTGACLALGIFASRVGGAGWLIAPSLLPLAAIWGAQRVAMVVAPLAFLAFVVVAWWARGAEPNRRRRWRVRLSVVGAGVLATVTLLAAFAVTRPSDITLLTDPDRRASYSRNATSQPEESGAGGAVPTGPDQDNHDWSLLNSGTFGRAAIGTKQALWFVPNAQSQYAGVRHDGAASLRGGATYSFAAAVRSSDSGPHALVAGAYGGTSGRSPVVALDQNHWMWIKVEGLTIESGGQPYFALRSASDPHIGEDPIIIDCMIVAKGRTLAAFRRAPTACPTEDNASNVAPQTGSGSGAPEVPGRLVREVPGRLTQYKAAQRFVMKDTVSLLLGHGLGTTAYAVNLGVAMPPHLDAQLAGYSDFGTLLVELGWLGVVLAVASAIWLGLACLSVSRRVQSGSWTQALLIAYPGILMAMAVLTMGGAPLRTGGSAAVFWILTGLVLASVMKQQDAREPRTRGAS